MDEGTGHGDVSLFKTGALNDSFDDKLGHYLPEEDCNKNNDLKSSILISDYNANENNNDAIPPVDLALLPCNVCGRTFQHESLVKHAIICQKTSNKKRKQFDSSRQRRQGTDLAQFLPKNFGLPENSPLVEKEKTPVPSKMPVKKHSPRNNGPSKLFSTPENAKCPQCGRGFGSRAFDRHVAWCLERSRLVAVPGANEVRVAKSRLMARTMYKAPPVRSRRSLTREKYSLSRSASVDSAVSDRSSNCVENRRLTDGPQHLPVIMKTPNKHKDREPLMTRSLTKPRFDDNYDPFLSAKRQMMDLMSSSTNIHKLDSSPNDYRKESVSFRSTNPIPYFTRDESSINNNSISTTHSPHFQRSRSLRNPPNKFNYTGSRLVATKLPNKSTSCQQNNNSDKTPNRTNKESPKIKNTNIRSDNKNKSMSYESSPFPNRTEKHRLIKLEPVDNITSNNYKNNNLVDSTTYNNDLSDPQEHFIDPRLINDKIPPSVQKLLDNPVLLSSTESLLCDNPPKSVGNNKKYKENQLNSDNEGSSTPTIDDLSAQYDKIMVSLEQSMSQVSTQDEDSLYNELEQLMSSLDDKPSNLNIGSAKKNTKTQIKNSMDGLSNVKKNNGQTKPKEVPYNKSISLNFSSVLSNPLPNPVYPIYSRSHTVQETQKQERKLSTKAIDQYKENESRLENDIMKSLKDIDVMCEKGSYHSSYGDGNVTAKKKNSAKIIPDHKTNNKIKEIEQGRKVYSRENSPPSKYTSKYIGDSAYGRNSLNRSSPSNRIVFRRSPSHKENSPIISRHPTGDGGSSTHSPIRDRDYTSPFNKDAEDPMWVDGQLSSSGSDASLSNVTQSLSRTSSTIMSATRMSKFCHDCGSKFPFETAKFCVECGARRLLV